MRFLWRLGDYLNHTAYHCYCVFGPDWDEGGKKVLPKGIKWLKWKGGSVVYKLSTLVKKAAWLVSTPARITRGLRVWWFKRSFDSQSYWPCACSKCGWVGSSEDLGGGERSYGDDYSEVYCNICGAQEDQLEEG